MFRYASTKNLLFLAMAGFSLIGASIVRANVLAWEGFNYSAGASLNAQNGGTGWSNSWTAISGNAATVNAGNLVAGSNAPSGFDSRSAGNASLVANNNRVGRWLDCSAARSFGTNGLLDTNGNIGADGSTIYVSFLQQPSSASTFYEFEFHRGDLGDPGRIAGIGNDLNSTTVNFRAPDSNQTPISPGSTNVNLYVIRIDFQAGNDDVYVYQNPTAASESGNEPALTMLGVADMSFNGISLAAFFNDVTSSANVTVKHDEIRLATTWGDALGGAPLFTLQPVNQNLYEGQTATLTALAASTQPVSYQWHHGSNSLPGQTGANLNLANLQPADSGSYYAVASNALGLATSSVATLTVQAISVSVPFQNLTVGAGSNLLIAANYNGASPASFQWFTDGNAVAGATNAAYAMSNSGLFAAGQYVLVASNAYGMATSAVVSVSANLGGILAYDGFDYPYGSGNLPGQNGGIGWSGAWSNLGGSAANVMLGNLPSTSNEPAGFDHHSLGNSVFQPNASRSGRFLDCSPGGNFALHGYIDGNGNIGADGKTLYISFLQQPNSPGQFYEFEFHRGDLGDPGRVAGIGNDVGDSDVHFRSESPAGGTSTFWDLGLGTTNVNFYVVRIDFKPGNDDVTVYRNPAGTNEASNAPVLIKPGAGDLSFNGISFAAYLNNFTVSEDEVRLGLTWNDVVGDTVSTLRLASHANGLSQIQVAASPGYTYQIQGAPVLAGPWTNVSSVTTSSLGTAQSTETNVWDPQRFYRAASASTITNSTGSILVLADFEGATYGSWISTGTAFGLGPAQGALSNQNPVFGYLGSGLVDSYNGGDAATGTLTSAAFTITKPTLSFFIGGGSFPGQECMNLVISNVVVASATGANSETLLPQQWDVRAYLGQSAVLQIVDAATGSWGHVLVDQIALTDVSVPQAAPAFVINNLLLNLPAKNGAASHRVTLMIGANAVRDFDMQLATGAPDWWAFADVSEFQGQTATLLLDSQPASTAFLNSLVLTNGIVGATNLYVESLRPQFHFSSKRGWLNDANGMIYYQGQYHLYYQHDPFNWGGIQKYWGHAVSQDMVQWQELPEAIYSHTYHDDVWSGSAVVDSANTSGFKTGTNDVIVAAFYSTARGECIAYSNDRGLTFSDYTNNPVVVHATVGRDPHLLWYAPSNYWVMAVYDATGGDGIQFYSSPNLRQWTYHSKIFGFFECPDLFQLPVDGNTNNLNWVVCDASSGYMLGQFDGATFTPSTAKLPGNSGSGFYASQTFTSMPVGDARKVRIGWAQIAMPGMPFNQMMYFPTALSLQTTASGVRLCSQPVAEIANLCINEYAWTNLTVPANFNPLSGIRGSLFNLHAQFVPGTQAIDFNIQGVVVAYIPTTQQITCNGVTSPLPAINGVVTLQILADRDSIEIFGNNGQLYMPLPATYPSTNGLISLSSQGGSTVFNSLIVDKLKSSWSGQN